MALGGYSSILDYCEKMSMSYSYKPVLILALLQGNGHVSLDDAASFFLQFYSKRLDQGLIAEKANSIYNNLNCTFEQVKQNIRANPIKALTSSSTFFAYHIESEMLEIVPSVWSSLSDGIKKSLRRICYERLDRYYCSIIAQANSFTAFQRPEDLNGYLSNDYISPFSISGEKFSSMTQFLTYRKSLLFGNEQLGRRILLAQKIEKCWEAELKETPSSRLTWEGQMQIIAYKGLLAKFTQNETLSQRLLDTGSTTIAACLLEDQLLGNGLDLMDSRVSQPAAWTGKNLLGYALMQVRSALFSMRSF